MTSLRTRTLPQKAKTILSNISTLAAAGAIAVASAAGQTATQKFGPDNPFYAPSTLPFQAPPFDKIKDSDYQPAIEAGMAEQIKEVETIANNPAPPTFENTIVALEKTGQLFNRVMRIRIPRSSRCKAMRLRSWRHTRMRFS
jgi:peptidyl-dipeptidase Dcp